MESEGTALPERGKTEHQKMPSRGMRNTDPKQGHHLLLATSHTLEAPAAGSHLFAMTSDLSSW